MSTILLVDDKAIFREPLAVCLRQNGYTTLTAESGSEALRMLAQQPPDLILLDIAMPQMDGLQLLRVLRRNPSYCSIPIILLSALSDRTHILEARRLGVRDYLLKSTFSLEAMLARIRARLSEGNKPSSSPESTPAPQSTPGKEQSAQPPAPQTATARASNGAADRTRTLAQLTPIITRDELIRIVTRGLELKALAPVVHSVMAATSSSTCSGEDVARAVAQDQALSVRVLKLANAASYSRGRPMHSLKDAIARIGIQEVRNLVMVIGVLESYDQAISRHMDARLFWEHSIACGNFASTLARACGESQWEQLFLPGTLHDVGRLVLCEHVPDTYAEVFRLAGELELPLELVEAKLLLFDHCRVLERALEYWKFPRELIQPAIAHHHSPQMLARLKPEHARMAQIIALADRLTHALLLGSSGNNAIYPISELMDALRIEPEALQGVLKDVAAATENTKLSVLARSQESVWSPMSQTVRGWLRRPVRPLCLSDTPGNDPYPLLFEQIRDPHEGPANLAILHLSDARTQLSVLSSLQKAESGPTGRLPAIIICQRGQVDRAHPALQDRPHELLRSPVRVETLVAAINRLLQQ